MIASLSVEAERARFLARMNLDNVELWADGVRSRFGVLSSEYAVAALVLQEAHGRLLATYGTDLAAASGVPVERAS